MPITRLLKQCVPIASALFFWAGGAQAYNLEISTDTSVKHYTQADIMRLAGDSLHTRTPWTDGLLHFQGVTLAALLSDAGLNSEQMRARSLNGYSVDIPVQTAIERGAFVAVQLDGEPMKVRDKGPFWIVFPWTNRPELLNHEVRSWSIWQLQRLERMD